MAENAFQYRSTGAFYKSHYKLMGSEKLIELKFARVLDEILILHRSALKHIVTHRTDCDAI